MMELNPNTKLLRGATAAALTEAGFPITETTLATMASRGGGPPFQKFGRRPIYIWSTSLAWAEQRLTAARSSTSEAGVVGARPKPQPAAQAA